MMFSILSLFIAVWIAILVAVRKYYFKSKKKEILTSLERDILKHIVLGEVARIKPDNVDMDIIWAYVKEKEKVNTLPDKLREEIKNALKNIQSKIINADR